MAKGQKMSGAVRRSQTRSGEIKRGKKISDKVRLGQSRGHTWSGVASRGQTGLAEAKSGQQRSKWSEEVICSQLRQNVVNRGRMKSAEVRDVQSMSGMISCCEVWSPVSLHA